MRIELTLEPGNSDRKNLHQRDLVLSVHRSPKRKRRIQCLAPEGTRCQASHLRRAATKRIRSFRFRHHLKRKGRTRYLAPEYLRPRLQLTRTRPEVAQASIADRRSKRARASNVADKPDESTAQVPRKTRKRQPKVYKKRPSDAVHNINNRVLQSRPHNTRQRKVYKQERGSRRLAGRLPEYGMLPKTR
jgi:hypothetical protein